MLPIIIDQQMNDSKMEWLAEVWDMISYRMSIPQKDGNIIFEEITKRYCEPHRTYHNLSHLYSMLMMAEEFYDFIESYELFELSIWFHDLIYDPERNDNEERSGQRAMEILSPYVPGDFLQQLNYMILSTVKHSPALSHHDNKLFLDLDLAILAADVEVYQKYSEAIRSEFSIFPDEIYVAGRKEVLKKFLGKKNIYFTDFFREKYEGRARENVERELAT